jgi:hypothetical protein
MNSLAAMPDLEFFLNLESEKDNRECHHCGSKKINIVYEKAPCQHYAAIRCGRCDAFKGWMEKPENTIKRNSTEEILNQLSGMWRILNNWENNFISNMKSRKKHSPRQLECLESIVRKYGLNN